MVIVGKLRSFDGKLSIIAFHLREVECPEEADAFHMECRLAQIYYGKVRILQDSWNTDDWTPERSRPRRLRWSGDDPLQRHHLHFGAAWQAEPGYARSRRSHDAHDAVG